MHGAKKRMERLTRARLDEILERCRGLRVAVVGDLMLDVYLVGAVSRISPEAPVPVVHVAEEWVALGGAMHDTSLKMELLAYVPVYRTPAATGGGWAFARWR